MHGTLANIWLACAPFTDQLNIAAFLDHKTAQIDALIAKKKTLIDKLAEKRIAVITQAVTRGLNSSVPLKDSGVEWLGQVPMHWHENKAKYSCEAIIDCKNRTPDYDGDGDFFVVRTTDVRDGRLNLDDALRTNEQDYLEWTQRGAPQRDDVLFTREAPAGEAAIYDGLAPICLGQRMMYFRTTPSKLNPEFLLFYIYSNALRAYIDSEAGGSTVSHLRLGQVYNLPVILPPVDEQQRIVVHLKFAQVAYENLVATTESAITRLTEYRSALITAATTGQIDVRAVPLAAGAP